jgi:hypothetical protein
MCDVQFLTQVHASFRLLAPKISCPRPPQCSTFNCRFCTYKCRHGNILHRSAAQCRHLQHINIPVQAPKHCRPPPDATEWCSQLLLVYISVRTLKHSPPISHAVQVTAACLSAAIKTFPSVLPPAQLLRITVNCLFRTSQSTRQTILHQSETQCSLLLLLYISVRTLKHSPPTVSASCRLFKSRSQH